MTRTIKFRGRCIDNHLPDTGKMVYGSLIAYEDNASSLHYFICSQGQEPFHVDYPVDPDSIAQFVGFDCDGNEVYEGDELVGANGFEFKARFVGNLTDGDKLKETQHVEV